ncbi:MAG TPA: amidohydrolase, partial [Methylomirabilota bacterium]|nr:amidohydrolase [Methylomirabilota bacterium]
MQSRDDVKRAVCDAIDRQSERIVTIGETIRKNPELGFKELKTGRLVEETMREIGLEPKGGLAVTGVRGAARGTKDGPTFALLGELD